MALGNDYEFQDCAISRALEVVGERWTILILRDCFLGVRRFSDLQVHLDIAKGVLTQRLAGLVEHGLLEKRSTGGHPEYVLTEAGLAFAPVLAALAHWGKTHANPDDRPTRQWRHLCGTELDPTGRCPTCDLLPPIRDVISAPDPDRPSRRTDPVARQLTEPHRMLEPIRP